MWSLNQHSFSTALEHDLAFAVSGTFHQLKRKHAGFLLRLSLQCSAPSRSILEDDMGQ